MTTHALKNAIVDAVFYTGSNIDEVARFIESDARHTAVVQYASNIIGYLDPYDESATWIDPQTWVIRSTCLTTRTPKDFDDTYVAVAEAKETA